MNNMTYMKKNGWRAAFAFLAAGCAFATPANAIQVDYTILNINNVPGIGDVVGSGLDILNLTNPVTGQQNLQTGVPSALLKLGTLSLSSGDNCGGLPCSGPLVSGPGGPAPLTFQFKSTINSTSVTQDVTLNYTWTPIVDQTGTFKYGTHLVFTDFAIAPIVLDFGFERLQISWQFPQDLLVDPLTPDTVTADIHAILMLLPEPASLSLFGLGLAAISARARRPSRDPSLIKHS